MRSRPTEEAETKPVLSHREDRVIRRAIMTLRVVFQYPAES